MQLNSALAENYPPQDPESIGPNPAPVSVPVPVPEIRLIQDGSEMDADLDYDAEQRRPELRAVQDPEVDTPETEDARDRAAQRAGRVISGTKARTVKSEISGSAKDYEDDSHRHRGFGAALWAAMKRLAAETHEDKCFCYICTSP